MTTENITEKIRKVLELARRGGTEAEADTAMKMALNLLAKHNLSMGDVESVELQDEDVTEERVDANRESWQGIVWLAVAKLYFCRLYVDRYSLNGKTRKSFVVIGKPSNISVATETARYLVDLGNELCKGGDALYRNSWKIGYSSRIAERCRVAIAEATGKLPGAVVTETALAVINLYAVTAKGNDDYLRSKGVRLRSTAGRSYVRNSEGYAAGRAAGDKVSLRGSVCGRIGN